MSRNDNSYHIGLEYYNRNCYETLVGYHIGCKGRVLKTDTELNRLLRYVCFSRSSRGHFVLDEHSLWCQKRQLWNTNSLWPYNMARRLGRRVLWVITRLYSNINVLKRNFILRYTLRAIKLWKHLGFNREELFELCTTQQVGFLVATNLWHCPDFASMLNINTDSWGGIERPLLQVCVEFDLYHVKTNKAFNWVFGVQRKFIEQLLHNRTGFIFWRQGGFKHKQSTFLRVCFLYGDMTCGSTVRILS